MSEKMTTDNAVPSFHRDLVGLRSKVMEVITWHTNESSVPTVKRKH